MSTPQPSLRKTYTSYITAIQTAAQTRDLSPIGRHFTHDTVVYNGERVSAATYQSYIHTVTAIPDLSISLRQLVASDDDDNEKTGGEGRGQGSGNGNGGGNGHVSAYIVFSVTPAKGSSFLGFEASGETVVFGESVIYTFAGGRIAEVWSVVDVDSVRKQFAAAAE